jgi:protein-disulfide isomerase
MRLRASTSFALTGLTGLFLSLLACRQPSADLSLPNDPSEPSGRGSPSVIVEVPGASSRGPILEWTAVDHRLDDIVTGIGGERMRVSYDEAHPWDGASVPMVTIVVFSDYHCPYCDRFDQTLDQLLGRYPAELRVVYRQFPLPSHREAEFAATVALAAHAQGQFVAMHRWLYENSHALTHMSVAERAASYGLDTQRLLDEVDGDRHAARIDGDLETGKRFGVTGTPAYFINGRPDSGAQPIEELDRIIREELALAQRLLAAGSTPEQVWARILAASTEAPASASPAVASKRYATQLAGLPRRGATNAKVEILMCGDFDCPYCKKSAATLAQLLQSHPNDLAIFFRNHPLPMHVNARAAHRAAVAADNQGQFWPMFDLLYSDTSKRSDAELEALAKQLGLDVKQFRKDVSAAKTEARIDTELSYCEQALDASGTPTFFINGIKLVGAQPLAEFEALVQAELRGP